jgi:hypothetical protein
MSGGHCFEEWAIRVWKPLNILELVRDDAEQKQEISEWMNERTKSCPLSYESDHEIVDKPPKRSNADWDDDVEDQWDAPEFSER